jgi:hypothetical protein
MPTIDLNPNLKNFLKTTTNVPLYNPRSNPLTPTFVNYKTRCNISTRH